MENNFNCSNEIKENIFNKDVILVKKDNDILCFTVDYIRTLIETKPYLIKSYKNPKKIFEDFPKNTKPSYEFCGVQWPIYQHIMLNENITVGYDFINPFLKGRNTFEISNKKEIYLFRDIKNYNIHTFFYDSKAIDRQGLLQDNVEFKNLSNEYTDMIKIKKQEEAIEYANNLKQCRNQNEGLVFDENLIMMFIEGNEPSIFCFSLDELINITTDGFDSIHKKILYDGTVIFKINDIGWIDILSIEKLINEKVNTIMLVKQDDYFKPFKSSRKNIFPNKDYLDWISSPNNIKLNEYYDEGDFRYRKIIEYFTKKNDDKKSIENIRSIRWQRYDKNKNEIVLMSYKNEPAFIEFQRNGFRVKEEFIFSDGTSKIVKFDRHDNKNSETWYNKNGKRHREDDLPAQIGYHGNKKVYEIWYKNDIQYREGESPSLIEYGDNENIILGQAWTGIASKIRDEKGLPTTIYFYENGSKKEERWHKNDELNRDNDLPSRITYYENGREEEKIWYKDGLIHRDNDLPAKILYYKNGREEEKTWYKDGEYHREGDLPAYISYYENGNKKEEIWYKNDNVYREGDLPVSIEYSKNGAIVKQSLS